MRSEVVSTEPYVVLDLAGADPYHKIKIPALPAIIRRHVRLRFGRRLEYHVISPDARGPAESTLVGVGALFRHKMQLNFDDPRVLARQLRAVRRGKKVGEVHLQMPEARNPESRKTAVGRLEAIAECLAPGRLFYHTATGAEDLLGCAAEIRKKETLEHYWQRLARIFGEAGLTLQRAGIRMRMRGSKKKVWRVLPTRMTEQAARRVTSVFSKRIRDHSAYLRYCTFFVIASKPVKANGS